MTDRNAFVRQTTIARYRAMLRQPDTADEICSQVERLVAGVEKNLITRNEPHFRTGKSDVELSLLFLERRKAYRRRLKSFLHARTTARRDRWR